MGKRNGVQDELPHGIPTMRRIIKSWGEFRESQNYFARATTTPMQVL